MVYESCEVIKSSDDKVPEPCGFDLKLFDYQLATVSRMKQYEKMSFHKNDNVYGKIRINTRSAILTTYKKRQSTLCLIQNTIGIPLLNNYVKYHGPIGYPEIDDRMVVDTTLIIYKSYMKPNWESEISKTRLTYKFISEDTGDFPDVHVLLVDIKKMYILFNTDYRFKRCIVDTDGEFKYDSNFPSSLFYWYMISKFTNLTKINQKIGAGSNSTNLLSLVTHQDDYEKRVIQVKNVQFHGMSNKSISRFNIFGVPDPIHVVETLLSNFGMCLSLGQIVQRIPIYFLSENRIQGIIERLNNLDKSCPICLEPEETTLVTKCCYSCICVNCYVNCLMSSSTQRPCPFCRKSSFSVYKLSASDVQILPDRYDTIFNILETHQHLDRILVVSDVVDLFGKIIHKFPGFMKLTGAHSKICDKLKKNKKILMSSSQNCFAGIPLPDFELVITDDSVPERFVNSVLSRINLPVIRNIKLKT